jgi:DNA topoisomerase-2
LISQDNGTLQNHFLKSFKKNCTECTINFELEFYPNALNEWCRTLKTEHPHINKFEKELKLTSQISTSNMHLFDENNIIHKYTGTVEILQSFYKYRLPFYYKRKEHQIQEKKYYLRILDNKIRFIKEINSDDIVIYKKTKMELTLLLLSRNYDSFEDTVVINKEEKNKELNLDYEINVNDSNYSNYSYLTSMRIDSMTQDTLEKMEQSRDNLTEEINILHRLSPEVMWINELDELSAHYSETTSAFLAEINKEINSSELSSSSNKKRSKKTKK